MPAPPDSFSALRSESAALRMSPSRSASCHAQDFPEHSLAYLSSVLSFLFSRLSAMAPPLTPDPVFSVFPQIQTLFHLDSRLCFSLRPSSVHSVLQMKSPFQLRLHTSVPPLDGDKQNRDGDHHGYERQQGTCHQSGRP